MQTPAQRIAVRKKSLGRGKKEANIGHPLESAQVAARANLARMGRLGNRARRYGGEKA